MEKFLPTLTATPIVLILAGGKGERFWPRSQADKPKQLQCIYSDKSLLEETLKRARLLSKSKKRIFICCSSTFRRAIIKSHPYIASYPFIIEPQGCNTAAIIALAALHLERRFPGAIHVVLPADHYVAPPEAFCKTVKTAMTAAKRQLLLTIGISPKRPETQYGYIHSGEKIEDLDAYKIHAFTEKPNLNTAQKYLAKGGYYWNSGIFVWSGNTILQEFRKHAREIYEPIASAFVHKGLFRQGLFRRRLKRAFEQEIPILPVDVAILEKSSSLAMVPASFQWDDLGSWTSLERIMSPVDSAGNILFSRRKQGHLSSLESHDNIVALDQKKNKGLVALLGVRDLVIVQEGDVLLVAKRNALDKMKELVKQVRENPSLQKYRE